MGALAWIAPQWAAKREEARVRLRALETVTQAQAAGYSRHGASGSKRSLTGWLAGGRGGSPDADLTDNLPKLRERSRDLDMSSPLAHGALRRIRSNVVGSGLRLNANIDEAALGLTPEEADAWETRVEREFSLWADNQDADAARTCTFGELQSLAFLSVLLSGDCFAVLPLIPRKGRLYDLRIYLMEGDRVADPSNDVTGGHWVTGELPSGHTLRGGVECDRYSAPVAYWIARKHPGDTAWSGMLRQEWARVLAFGSRTGRRNVLHLYEPERPEQRRGIPILAPVIEKIKQIDRYTDAEVSAAVITAAMTVFIKSELGQMPVGSGVPEDMQITETGTGGTRDDQASIELAPGSIVDLAPGESIETFNPMRPNQAFDGFIQSVLRQIGSALEIPFELLILHFTSSYSAARAALVEFWRYAKHRRSWLAQTMCQPIYDEWLTEAVAKGRIDAPGFLDDPAIRAAWSRAQWHGPSPGQIDPVKEANAAKIRVDEGFSTRARETAELTGEDWADVHRQRVTEERMRREGGLTVQPAAGFPPQLDDDEEAQ